MCGVNRTEGDEAAFPAGSVYEPLKSIHLLQPDHESLWEKLDRYYRIGERRGRAFGPALAPLRDALDITCDAPSLGCRVAALRPLCARGMGCRDCRRSQQSHPSLE